MQLFPARSAITGRIDCYERDATSVVLLCPACPSRRGGGVRFRLTVLGILRDTASTKAIEEQGYLFKTRFQLAGHTDSPPASIMLSPPLKITQFRQPYYL